MSKNSHDVPILGGDDAALVTAVNEEWAREGSGPPDFWVSPLGSTVLRDSAASENGIVYPESVYPLVSTTLVFNDKEDNEERDVDNIAAVITIDGVRARRIDGPSVPFDTVQPRGPLTAMVEQAVSNAFVRWGRLLPIRAITGLLVNRRPFVGADQSAYPLQTTYDGQAPFSTTHKINPMLGAVASNQFSNIITLAKPIDESGWGEIWDQVAAIPDLDGETLANVDGADMPMIMVATKKQAIRWAHILGPNGKTPENLIMENMKGTAGISSVVVGEARIVVNPYLIRYAESANLATVRRRSYLFTNAGRKPFIYRETVAPFIDEDVEKRKNVRRLYVQARIGAAWAEYRGVIAIDEGDED